MSSFLRYFDQHLYEFNAADIVEGFYDAFLMQKSHHPGLFPFHQTTYFVYIFLNFTLFLAVVLCTRTAIRNALVACHVQFFEWSHEITITFIENIYTGVVLGGTFMNIYPTMNVVEWDQESMWTAAFQTDPRIKDFFIDYKPFFVCYKKWVALIFGEVVAFSVCLVLGLLFLAHIVPFSLFILMPVQAVCFVVCAMNLTLITPYQTAFVAMVKRLRGMKTEETSRKSLNYIAVTNYVSLAVAIFNVTVASFTIYIIANYSGKMLSTFRVLIIVQITATLLLCLLLPAFGLYTVLPIPILFSSHPRLFPSYQWTYLANLLQYGLLFSIVTIGGRAIIRSAFISSHVKFFNWSHEKTLRFVESINTWILVLGFLLNIYPALNIVVFEQDEWWAAAFRVDPRLVEFGEEYRPFFVCYRRWAFVILFQLLVGCLVVLFNYIFLARVTMNSLVTMSKKLKRIQKRMLLMEVASFVAFGTFVVIPLFLTGYFSIMGSRDLLRKVFSLLTITFAFLYFKNHDLLDVNEKLAEEKATRKLMKKEVVFKNVHQSYRVLISPDSSQCSGRPKVLIIVLSTAEHFEQRQVIRNTYGNPKLSKSVAEKKILVNFIMSRPKSHDLMQKLNKESAIYDDIVVTDLPEHYFLLHLKVFALLDFFRDNCPQADFVLKVDEDVVVDVDRMLYFIERDIHANILSISGIVWVASSALRDPTNKWYVTKEEWPEYYYPRYCDGPFYLIGRSAVKRLLHHAKTTHAFRFEVFFL
ncbi:unnamed protein product [Caenorhabditis auriculariae]|uniref:G protein-coupled receptor n=1 Tax=Caenorhabditis auriculariae TaxID=2777116 RepID=A0A8S1HNM5_9PELO|nr:unnamed protein product [Caenorhabditis auriculariae]